MDFWCVKAQFGNFKRVLPSREEAEALAWKLRDKDKGLLLYQCDQEGKPCTEYAARLVTLEIAPAKDSKKSWCDRAIAALGGVCPDCGGPINQDYWGLTIGCTTRKCGHMFPDGIWIRSGPRVKL